MESIPFKIPVGIEPTGIVRFEPPYLVIEFGKWSWKSFSRLIKEVQIPTAEIVNVRLNSRFLETSIDIQMRSMKVMEDIPYSRPGLLQLQFTRRDRESARRLASALSLEMSERKLEQLEREMKRMNE